MNWPRLYSYMNIYVTKIAVTLATIVLRLLKIGCELVKIALTCLFSTYISGFEDWV